jgi:AraC-like DNA-binding protein
MGRSKKFPDIGYPSSYVDNYRKNVSNIDIFCWEKETVIDQKASITSLFFIMEGRVEVCSGFVSRRKIKKGFFFLIPPEAQYSIRLPKDGKMIVFRLEEDVLLKYISKDAYEIYKKKDFKHEVCDVLTIHTDLNVNNLLKDYMSAIDRGLYSGDYSLCKTEELLILLKNGYSEELLAWLFQPVFKGRIIFKSIILQNRNKLFTVEEFAAVTHLNRNTFRLRFKEIFGMTPVEWIQRERATSIFRELTETEKPILSVMTDYGFSNFPNFVRFCRMHLKSPPGLVRKEQSISKKGKMT